MKFWEEASIDLGIKVEHGIILPEFENVGIIETLVPCFGGRKGIIVVNDYDCIADIASELGQAGYAYSSFNQNGPYDRDSAIDMLRDWGWTCNSAPPSWY